MKIYIKSCLFLLTPTIYAFESGELFFENINYLEATKSFLNDAPINDVRVYSYLSHIKDNNLVDLKSFDDSLLLKWNERFEHLPYVPKGIAMGDIYLEISLAAQLYNKSPSKKTEDSIYALSKQNQLGFGYFVVGRLKENSTTNLSNKKLKELITIYENGADFGDSMCVFALGRLAKSGEKLSIKKQYFQEYTFLKSNDNANGHAQTLLSRMYATGMHNNEYGNFPKNQHKKTYWQLEAARQGSTDLQAMLSTCAEELQKEMKLGKTPEKTQKPYWGYMAAMGGDLQCKVSTADCLSNTSENDYFPGNYFKALNLLEEFINYFDTHNSQEFKSLYTYALMLAGNIYDKGHGGVPINEEKALTYYTKAADLFNDPQALFNTGSMMEHGRGIHADIQKARTYFEKAAGMGNDGAQMLLASRFLYGYEGYERNTKKGLIYLKMLEKKEHPEALYYLYQLYMRSFDKLNANEYPVQYNKEIALKYLKSSAIRGYKDSQINWVLEQAKNYDQLPDDELILLIKFISDNLDNHPRFNALLGTLYMQGYKNIIEVDYSKALSLFQKGAEAGDEVALNNLGYAYEKGLWGLKQSWDKAAEYYQQCPNNPNALTNLGFLNELGKGVQKNIDEAIRLYKKAFEMDCAPAANNLGALYQNGIHVDKDDSRAFAYYKKGWELGDKDAGLQYAKYVLTGTCCSQDIQEAKKIVFCLDETDPDVLFTQGIILLNEDSEKAMSKLQQSMDLGSPWAAYLIGLQLYQFGSQSKESENSHILLKQSIEFLKQASDLGLDQATSALRILQKNYEGYESDLSDIIKKLVQGNLEEARAISQEVRSQKNQSSSKQLDLEKDHYIKQISTKDISAAQKRDLERLEQFLDPKNRKTISVQDLQKIASSAINTSGGSIAPTKGSGNRITIGDQTLGFHNMHRSGQSSRTTLDPGRVKSFQNFIKSSIPGEKD